MVLALNSQNDIVTVKIDENIESFPISKISSFGGQFKLCLCTQIGQFVLAFQRIENRLKGFIDFIFNLDEFQRILLTGNYTAGKLLITVDAILKQFGQNEEKENWRVIKKKIEKLNEKRVTLIHGFNFPFNEELELDLDSMYFFNSTGKKLHLNFNKLNKLNLECFDLYYETFWFLERTGKRISDSRI